MRDRKTGNTLEYRIDSSEETIDKISVFEKFANKHMHWYPKYQL
jgi:hypothetical protein